MSKLTTLFTCSRCGNEKLLTPQELKKLREIVLQSASGIEIMGETLRRNQKQGDNHA